MTDGEKQEVVERVQTTIRYRKDGVVDSLELFVPKAQPVAASLDEVVDDGVDDGLGPDATDEERALETQTLDVIVRHLTQMNNQSERYVKELDAVLSADGETLLTRELARLERSEAKLPFLRVKRRLDQPAHGKGASPVLEQFTETEVQDLADADEVGRLFPANVVDAYSAMEPCENGVWLLVIENLASIAEPSYLIMQRMFCYVARRCNATGADGEIEPNNRTAAVQLVQWGYTALERRSEPGDGEKAGEGGGEKAGEGGGEKAGEGGKKAGAPSAEERERVIVVQRRLGRAQALYARRRQAQRRALMTAQLPRIAEFVLAAFGAALVARRDGAAPNLPPKLMVRVPVEGCGSLIDYDGMQTASLDELRARASELRTEAVALATRLKAATEASERADADDDDRAIAQASTREAMGYQKMLAVVADIERALASIDPERQLLLHVVDEGLYQDIGQDVQALYTIDVPYDALRKNVEAVARQLAAEAAKPEPEAGAEGEPEEPEPEEPEPEPEPKAGAEGK